MILQLLVASSLTAGHASFIALPSHNGLLTLPWMNGEPQVSLDRSPGSMGELYGFGWSDKLYLYKSGNFGASWSFVDPTAGETIGSFKLIGATQDSAGKAHLLFFDTAAGVPKYARVALDHTGGAITGFHSEVKNVALPGTYNGTNDIRGYVLPVIDQGGTEVLVFSVNDNPLTSASHFRIQLGKGPLNAMVTGDFTKLDGTAGATVAFNGGTGLDNHDHSALMAQLGATKDLWIFWGPIDAEYGLPDPTFMTRLQVSTSGAHTWSVGAPIAGVGSDTTSSPELMAVVGTQNYVWMMYLNPMKGLSIDRVAGNGTYSTDAVPSPDSTAHRNGVAVFSVADDESRVWVVWNTLTSSSSNFVTKEAFFDGATWTSYADSAPFVGDSWGMAMSWGWREGVVAVRLDGNNNAIQLASVFSGNAGSGGGAAGTGGGTAGTGGGSSGTGGGAAGTGGGGSAGTGGGAAGGSAGGSSAGGGTGGSGGSSGAGGGSSGGSSGGSAGSSATDGGSDTAAGLRCSAASGGPLLLALMLALRQRRSSRRS